MGNEFDVIVARLAGASSVLVLTHDRPDGDGLGAMAALYDAGVAAGKGVRTLVSDKVPARYDFLFEGRPPLGAADFDAAADASDAILVVDTCAKAQVLNLWPGLEKRRPKVLVLDHHSTADTIGAVQWIDSSAAASGVLAGELIDALGWPLTPLAAECLMTAITSDTGWLRFANTDARCLRAVARCIDAGVRPDRLYMRLYQCDRPQRLRLLTRMLETLELASGNRLASMLLRKADFEATGALAEETENLVNEALRIGSVETALLLVENGDCIRVSLRSRDAVNVAHVAQRFGGGGHARAAGFRLVGDIDDLRRRLVLACQEELERPAAGSAS